MSTTPSEHDFATLLEQLAALEHQRWAHWQRYVHSQGSRQADGSLVLPAHLVQHWEHQIGTPYEDLPNTEKESDREQVRKYFPLLQRWLSTSCQGLNQSA
jgi:hypothetical protein